MLLDAIRFEDGDEAVDGVGCGEGVVAERRRGEMGGGGLEEEVHRAALERIEDAKHLDGEGTNVGGGVEVGGGERIGNELGAFEVVLEREDEPGGNEVGEGLGGEQDEGSEVTIDEVGGDVGPAAPFEHAEESFVAGPVAGPRAFVSAGDYGSEVGDGGKGGEDHLMQRLELLLELVAGVLLVEVYGAAATVWYVEGVRSDWGDGWDPFRAAK
jgi:hypothetical protein